MFKFIEGLPSDVLAIEAIGTVTSEDYRHTLVPAAEAMIAKGPIRMLYVIGKEFKGFELETRDLPERGRIGIFNRSYYEEVLIIRVHPELLKGEALVDPPHHHKTFWHERYRSIRDLEKHLHANGTRVVKFFLHLSKEEQRKRFLERIDEPDHNWKFSRSDVQERAYWKDYTKAYEECLTATSSPHAPWHVVPADNKENARLIVSQTILDTLGHLKMAYPKTTPKRKRELKAIRSRL